MLQVQWRAAEISGVNEVAESNGFLVVYPEQSFFANLLKCWNWFDPKHQSRDNGEPSILAAIAGQVCSSHEIDLDRVYVAGVSAGGAMAVIAAATYPDLFAGVAVCSGAEFKAAGSVSAGFAVMQNGGPDPAQQGQAAFEAMKPGLARRARRRTPVIVFHGSRDERVVPVNAEQIIAQWSTTNALLDSQNGDGSLALSERILDGCPAGGPSLSTLSRRCRRMIRPFRSRSLGASHHLPAWSALIAPKSATRFQPRLKLSPRPQQNTTKPILLVLILRSTTSSRNLSVNPTPFNLHDCLPMGGFLQTAVSDAPRTMWRTYLRSNRAHPIQRFWGRRPAANAADLPAKAIVHPFSVQAVS